MISFTAHFARATNEILSRIIDLALKPKEQLTAEDLDKIVYLAQDGSQLLESTDKALQDLAKGSVDRACSQLLTRRDSWLGRMLEVPRKESDQLRACDLNARTLFMVDSIEVAKKALATEKTDQVQSKFLSDTS